MQSAIFQTVLASGSLTTVILAWLVLKAFAADRQRDRIEQRLETLETRLHIHNQMQRDRNNVTHNADQRSARFLDQ